MGDAHPRHRYGTYALILALFTLAFAGFSKGAVWATVEDESSRTIEDAEINVSIEGDLHLREMDITILSEVEITGFPIAL